MATKDGGGGGRTVAYSFVERSATMSKTPESEHLTACPANSNSIACNLNRLVLSAK